MSANAIEPEKNPTPIEQGVFRRILGEEEIRSNIVQCLLDNLHILEDNPLKNFIRIHKPLIALEMSAPEINDFFKKNPHYERPETPEIRRSIHDHLPMGAEFERTINQPELWVVRNGRIRVLKIAPRRTFLQLERKGAKIGIVKSLGDQAIRRPPLRTSWRKEELASGIIVARSESQRDRHILFAMKDLLERERVLPRNLITEPVEALTTS